MKKIILSLAVALTTIVSAYAGEMEGVIASVDHGARTIVLEDGLELMIAESVEHGDLAEGQTVSLMTDDTSGEVIEFTIAE